MKILIVSALFYPAQSPNVYRWDAIARHWTEQGHEVHWLCTRFGGEPLETKINGIFVHRVGHHTLLDGWYNLLGVRRERRGLPGSGLPKQSRFRHLMEGIVNLTWRKLYWPDGACLWYFPAKRKALELMRRHKFDAVISVSLPFTAARIAQAVKEKHPHIHWLMDIEDPFSFVKEYFINNRAVYQKWNVRAEERALQLADTVTVTVESARKKYISHFPFVENKISVVPPLYEKVRLSVELPDGFNSEKTHIHLGYFGTFYFPIRSPEGFLKLLRMVAKAQPKLAKRLVMHFVGAIPVEYNRIFDQYPELRGMLRFYGLVPREQAAAMMAEMDFVVNIGNSTDYHLPSKSAEYLMSGKPIVNIATIEADTFAGFMKDYPLLLTLILAKNEPDESQVKDLVEYLLVQKGKQVEMKKRRALGAPYSVEEVAEQYFKCLE